MEAQEIKNILESLLFAFDQPLTISVMKSVLGEAGKGIKLDEILLEIQQDYVQRHSPIELRFIAGGWQFSTKKEYSMWIKKLHKDKTTFKLSPSALEALAVIAYKQPITRAEIEEVRGVETSGVIDTLLERKLARIVGRKETIGRPLLYGTTNDFLRHFGLSHLSELPALEELAPPQEEAAVQTEQIPELPFVAEQAEEGQHTSEQHSDTSEVHSEMAGAVPADVLDRSEGGEHMFAEALPAEQVQSEKSEQSETELSNTHHDA